MSTKRDGTRKKRVLRMYNWLWAHPGSTWQDVHAALGGLAKEVQNDLQGLLLVGLATATHRSRKSLGVPGKGSRIAFYSAANPFSVKYEP